MAWEFTFYPVGSSLPATRIDQIGDTVTAVPGGSSAKVATAPANSGLVIIQTDATAGRIGVTSSVNAATQEPVADNSGGGLTRKLLANQEYAFLLTEGVEIAIITA